MVACEHARPRHRAGKSCHLAHDGSSHWPSPSAPPSVSGGEELVGEIVRRESAEKSSDSDHELAREPTPGDDDTRVPPTGLEPLTV